MVLWLPVTVLWLPILQQPVAEASGQVREGDEDELAVHADDVPSPGKPGGQPVHVGVNDLVGVGGADLDQKLAHLLD